MKPVSLPRTTEKRSPREVAAEWLQLEEEGRLGPDDQARLEAWLAADPRHREAFESVRYVYGLSDGHAAAPNIMQLRQAALAAGRRPRAPVWSMAAAALVALTLGLGWSALSGLQGTPSLTPSPLARIAEAFSATAKPDSAVYRTRVGERLTFTLPDGSVSTLNTDSILKVAYRDGERGVKLIRGQALFEVAKNKQVPFRVYAGDRRITAVGTVFDVRLDGEKVKVALVEGVVQVASAQITPGGRPAQHVQMTAGEVLEAPKAAPMLVVTDDVRRSVSWTSGVVEFSGEPLSQAVAELNRYTTQPIEVGDASVGAYRVSGVFRTGDPETFARMMSEVFPLNVEHRPGGGGVILERRVQ